MGCNVCNKGISEKVSSYSKEKFGVELCFDHQKSHQGISNLSKATNGAVVTPPKPYPEELVEDEDYSGAFKGMIFNQSVENARAFEKTYEDVKRNLPNYYSDMFKLAVELTKRR